MSVFTRERPSVNDDLLAMLRRMINDQISQLLNTQNGTIPYNPNDLYNSEIRERVRSLVELKRSISRPKPTNQSCGVSQDFDTLFGGDE